MNDKDVRIIASILARLKKDKSMYAYDLASKAKHKLEHKIHQAEYIEMAADLYLEIILKDYNYLNSHQSRL